MTSEEFWNSDELLAICWREFEREWKSDYEQKKLLMFATDESLLAEKGYLWADCIRRFIEENRNSDPNNFPLTTCE